MGLSVGVVSIEYQHNPPGTVRNFLGSLVDAPDIGIFSPEGASGYWCGMLDDEGLLGIHQDEITARAEDWCAAGKIPDAARAELMAWLAGLPWKDGFARLHLVF